MSRLNQLKEIHQSGKPYIIYKSKKGFNLYTNFSKKIILNNKNIKSFLTKKNKKKSKDTDLFIGFFGYELLNNLIDVKIPKQNNLNFPKGIFYKPGREFANYFIEKRELATDRGAVRGCMTEQKVFIFA